MALSSEDLKKFLSEELGVDTADVEDSSELFSSGVIDSTALVLLIAFIEESCGFELSPMDVTLENLDTIDRILEFTASQAS